MIFPAFIPTIPLFQHSIVPCGRQKSTVSKRPLISVGCRNSEAFNYGTGLQVDRDLKEATVVSNTLWVSAFRRTQGSWRRAIYLRNYVWGQRNTYTVSIAWYTVFFDQRPEVGIWDSTSYHKTRRCMGRRGCIPRWINKIFLLSLLMMKLVFFLAEDIYEYCQCWQTI